ncbi:uncharacterized protein BHQ10_002688 [Talaromyces amestolkiae]|uniref:Uncharacterized protein n=1 Tax=Talaromyces amestolkiae TaxID=1196081 RepID=A0A364KSZ7_TALAM|nr:uncharacterized protein BHQ10_002688 [Talaromyces amestolkiae]RAO66676.1 hypothetical protein BHQ10_002688 [Talaromyces amestolkiae]
MGAIWTQMYPPSPHFTEKDLPSLVGKVFIVTGGNAGVGLELVKILFSKGGTVYMAGRSATKIAAEIEAIQAAAGTELTEGKLKSLIVDLSDLSTIRSCASTFLSQESRLDVLFNNAGLSRQPPGSVTAQGHELHMGTNCLGPYLLTKLLLPILIETARTAPKDSVRVVFTSSGIIDLLGPPGGVSFAELEPGKHSKDMNRNYSASKAGNWFLASEFDKRYAKDGIVSVVQNPGTIKTKGWDGTPWLVRQLMRPLFYPPRMGAYTGLWAGLSPDVKSGDGQKFINPWGRWYETPKKEIVESLKTSEEGGTGLATEFYDYCELHTKEFAI